MAPLIRKRKRGPGLTDTNVLTVSSSLDFDSQRLQALLRRNFEATFEPLPNSENAATSTFQDETRSTDEGEETAWEGLSDTEEQNVDVVQHLTSRSAKSAVSREELKKFMTPKPPKPDELSTSLAKRNNASSKFLDDANDDTANLKKDLALQRLLKESHLLDQQSSLSHVGQTRHKALDLRLQDMGSKTSLYSQQQMPLAQRRGIHAKKAEREQNRRREAQENGVILERIASGKAKGESKRERTIGAPAVGKFRGGTLQLSKRDVAHIQGSKKAARARR